MPDPVPARPAGPRRGAFVIALAAVAAAVVATSVAVMPPGPDRQPVPAGSEVPAADALSVAWVCAEGTGDPGGRAPATVWIANPSGAPAAVQVTVQAGGSEVGRRALALPGWSVVAVPVGEVAAAADPVVLVEATGGRVVVAHSAVAAQDVAVAPCRRPPVPTMLLAGATTLRGAQTVVAVANPFPDDAIVDISVLTLGGLQAPERLQGLIVPRHSRITVPLGDVVRRQAVLAARVTTRRGRVVAEASLRIDGVEGRTGFALSAGVARPARRFGFPSGAATPGRAQQLTLANPADRPARARVRVRLDGRARLAPRDVVVPARGLVTLDVGERVPVGEGFSVVVDATRPVVAQMLVASRAPAAPASRGIAWPAGQHEANRRWVLVPARASGRSADVLVVAGAARRAVRVRVQAFADGQRRDLPGASGLRIPPGRRQVFDLARLGVQPGDGLLVTADGPVWTARDSWAGPGISIDGGIPDPSG